MPQAPLEQDDMLTIKTRIPADIHERAVAVASQEDRSLASLLRMAVMEYVERREDDGRSVR